MRKGIGKHEISDLDALKAQNITNPDKRPFFSRLGISIVNPIIGVFLDNRLYII
jgi:hypothetical protein